MNLIELNMDKIIALCKKYKVSKLFVFGSILTNHFFDLKYALEDILGREVDLLEEHAIRNHYLKETIEQTKALIYG